MSEIMLRDNKGKLRLSLVPRSLIHAVCRVLMFGAVKYSPDNWRKGGPWTEVYDCAQRHMDAWLKGEDNDPESGLNHLAHAACNLAFLLEFIEAGRGTDNRFRYPVEPAANDDKPTMLKTGSINSDRILPGSITPGKIRIGDQVFEIQPAKQQLPPWGIPFHTGGEVKGRAQPVWQDGSPMRVPMPEVRS